MALPRGTKRYIHTMTGEVRYFRNPPSPDTWNKIGTSGSKNWKWINNCIEEKFIGPQESIPEGFTPGRLKV